MIFYPMPCKDAEWEKLCKKLIASGLGPLEIERRVFGEEKKVRRIWPE